MSHLATIIALVSLAASGCGQDSAEPSAPQAAAAQDTTARTDSPVVVAGPAQASPEAAEQGGTCPVRGRAFHVMTNDIEGGIALEIGSETLLPAETEAIALHLRDVSREVATGQPMPGPVRGTAATHAMRRMPDVEVEVERTGERIWMTIEAEEQDDVPRVRELGRQAADAIRRGDCPLHGPA